MSMEPNATLSARLYGAKLGDYQLVSGWWGKHADGLFTETVLPPVGVIIEADGEECAALWCYESFGIGVAFLEFPISRPGMPPKMLMRVFGYAVEACVAIVKARAKEQGGDYCVFRCSTIPSIARLLPSLGFSASSTVPLSGFIMRKD